MNDMTVSSVLSLFPETKEQISAFADKAVETALKGYENPLKINVQISAMENVLKSIKENVDFKSAVLKEAEKYGIKTFSEYNSQIQVKETGVKYDYSFCGHSEYDRVCAEIELLSQRKKSLEKYLQSLQYETPYVDPQTGEEIVLVPPTKTSTTSVVVTINK